RTADLKQGLFEANTPLDLTATVGSLKFKGLTTSSGQFVQQIEIDNIALRSRNQRNQGLYRDGLVQERDRLWKRIHELRNTPAAVPVRQPRHHVEFDTVGSLLRELTSVEAEIKTLDAAQAELKGLEDKAAAGTLAADEQQRLDRDREYLAGVDKGGFA